MNTQEMDFKELATKELRTFLARAGKLILVIFGNTLLIVVLLPLWQFPVLIIIIWVAINAGVLILSSLHQSIWTRKPAQYNTTRNDVLEMYWKLVSDQLHFGWRVVSKQDEANVEAATKLASALREAEASTQRAYDLIDFLKATRSIETYYDFVGFLQSTKSTALRRAVAMNIISEIADLGLDEATNDYVIQVIEKHVGKNDFTQVEMKFGILTALDEIKHTIENAYSEIEHNSESAKSSSRKK